MENTYSAGIVMVLVLVAAGGIGTAGIMYITYSQAYDQLSEEYQDLLDDYELLSDDYAILTGQYNVLDSEYNTLESDYATLQELYDDLQDEYDLLEAQFYVICLSIKGQILPLQTSTWAEAVRRVYLDYYLDQGSDTKAKYIQYAAFCRDLILHASGQYDAFSDVSTVFEPALIYGTDTMLLAHNSMRVMAHAKDSVWDHFPFRWGWEFSGFEPEIYGIDKIVQDCIDNLEYEYDTDITYYQEDPQWDYPKHPVETAFRMMGDCEDQAMMLAAYLERSFFTDNGSRWYETAFCLFHDADHRDYGTLYHGAVLVHIEDTATFWDDYPTTLLWRFGYDDPYWPDYTWCFTDPTWDVTFGNTPTYMYDYIDNGLSYDDFTIAYCEIDGVVK